MKISNIIFPAALLLAVVFCPVTGAAKDTEAEDAMRAAEALRAEAARLQQGADEQQLEARELQRESLELARDGMRAAQTELRQAQAEMREASRAVARAQREMMKDQEFAVRRLGYARLLDFPNRAIIGVIMGELTDDNGVTVIGLTPGGPAEIAGLQKGDVLIGVNDRIFAGTDDEPGTDIIKGEIAALEPGDKVELLYQRDGADQSVILITQAREPLTIHSMIRIADAPFIKQQILRVIEQIEVPEVNVEVLENKLALIEEKLIDGQWSFGGPHYNVQIVPGAEFTYEVFSDLASSAIDNTMVWFSGSQYVQGLQFAAMNDDLGVYFDTPHGVLVLRAREDNSLDLRSGDVILEINGKAVNQPADVMRELRFVEDNAEAELLVMRNRNLESLVIVLPEKQAHSFKFHFEPEAEN